MLGVFIVIQPCVRNFSQCHKQYKEINTNIGKETRTLFSVITTWKVHEKILIE